MTRAHTRNTQVLNAACDACKASIEAAKGKLAVKEAARAVSERDDRLLAEKMEALEAANREVRCCGRPGCALRVRRVCLECARAWCAWTVAVTLCTRCKAQHSTAQHSTA
jgi:hypothetical protein